MHQVSGRVHREVGILRLSRRVSTRLMQQLVHAGWLGENVHKTRGGNPEAEFPPQICGPGLPRHVKIAQRAAQVKVTYLGGGVQGCCPDHYVLHRKCPDRYVSSSIWWWAMGRAWYCAKVSAVATGRDCTEAS